MDAGLDRARGSLWGQAIGDALGTTMEFSTPRQVRPFPDLNEGPHDDLIGGGPFSLEPGQVTDDTQMAACLASSLAARGELDPVDVSQRYVAWSKVAFDIGKLTRSVLAGIAGGTPPLEAGYGAWEAGGRVNAPNGSLMRCSPLPVFFRRNPEALRRAALTESLITHADPRCRLACASFAAAIRLAIVEPAAKASQMHAAAMEELEPASRLIETRTPATLVKDAVAALSEDLDLAARPDPQLDVTGYEGFVRIAFRLAFWELLHAPDFRAGVIDVANRGGDTDTNAAIAGALLGALHGEAGVPKIWRRCVESACHSPPWEGHPFAGPFHPDRLFDILGSDA